MEEDNKSDESEIQIYAASVSVMSAGLAGMTTLKSFILKEPSVNMDIARNAYIDYIINRSDKTCVEQLRMSKPSFYNLCAILSERNLLKATLDVPVEHQVAMFLPTIAHDVRNSTIASRFFRSGETVSRYFNTLLAAILTLRNEYIVQPRNGSPTPEKIANNPRYWSWFQDCIGAIDGTHVRAQVPVCIQGRFCGRKDHLTQNVLAAISFDLRFTYILAGCEGYAHDSLILDDALTRHNGLLIPHGKYFLVDAGYGIRKGLFPPYRGVRYHLKEYIKYGPENYKELFNLRHSCIRTAIERVFGVLKKRFPLLYGKYWQYETQVIVVIVCCVLHNYIMDVDADDEILLAGLAVENSETDSDMVSVCVERSSREERNESCEWTQKRDALVQAMYNSYIENSNTDESP